ncbi:hypothetical protein AB0D14_37035 [Streptomyces sp. NPDC048484]|uniref:hypothetical protein n=1 Tax=Streptomyces sp. NPDC048484 TaxID=3155146 RepID=UPI00343F8796
MSANWSPRYGRSLAIWPHTPGFANLEDSALGHLPSGKFTANIAWLTLAATAYNLTRAIGYLVSVFHGKARTGTIRQPLIQIPARIARPGRGVVLHLPQRWR